MYKIFTISLCLFVISCATPYQKRGAFTTGGFSESRTSENGFMVDYLGNGYVTLDKAKDYALLRSAEISSLLEHDFFVIDLDKSNYFIRRVTTCYNAVCSTTVVQLPSSVKMITLHKDEQTKNSHAYKADDVIEKIRAKYEITKSATNVSDKDKVFEEFKFEKPKKGYGMVYIIRSGKIGSLVKSDIYIGGPSKDSRIGFNRTRQYVNFELKPGEYELFSKFWIPVSIPVEVKAGKTLFISQGSLDYPYNMLLGNGKAFSLIEKKYAQMIIRGLKKGTLFDNVSQDWLR